VSTTDSRAFASPEYKLNLIAESFYEVVDPRYATYCSLTARVLVTTLRRLNTHAELLPCQLIGTSEQRSLAIGFTGQHHQGKWDGHVVCATETHLLDAAVSHLEHQAGIAAPRFAIVPRTSVPSRIYGLASLNNGTRLLWSHPPEGFDLEPPEEPAELCDSLAALLWTHLEPRIGLR
jgi:hypothetical protein